MEQGDGPVRDSRIIQARAAIDDARTSLADLAEQVSNDHLHAARCSLNLTLRYLDMVELQHPDQPASRTASD